MKHPFTDEDMWEVHNDCWRPDFPLTPSMIDFILQTAWNCASRRGAVEYVCRAGEHTGPVTRAIIKLPEDKP